MSWDLKIGEIQEKYVTEDVVWQAINQFYYRSYTTMSYKYGFFKALLENLYNVNEKLELKYDCLFSSFAKIYWNLVVHHQLWQSNSKNQQSSIQKILNDYCESQSIPHEWTFDQLPATLQLDIISNVKKAGKRYVIGAFYGDTNSFFYEFNLKEEYLRLNKPVYQFLQKHHRVLMTLTNYHLTKFLEKHNEVPNVEYLLTKVEVVSQRGSLKEFYTILKKYEQNRCFYCGGKLSNEQRKTHVDHFIPWSYVQSDNLWNLVLACSTCNSKKSDKIAEEEFLKQIIDRNDNLISTIHEEKDYFYSYNEKKLLALYQYSTLNGYEERWKPVR